MESAGEEKKKKNGRAHVSSKGWGGSNPSTQVGQLMGIKSEKEKKMGETCGEKKKDRPPKRCETGEKIKRQIQPDHTKNHLPGQTLNGKMGGHEEEKKTIKGGNRATWYRSRKMEKRGEKFHT